MVPPCEQLFFEILLPTSRPKEVQKLISESWRRRSRNHVPRTILRPPNSGVCERRWVLSSSIAPSKKSQPHTTSEKLPGWSCPLILPLYKGIASNSVFVILRESVVALWLSMVPKLTLELCDWTISGSETGCCLKNNFNFEKTINSSSDTWMLNSGVAVVTFLFIHHLSVNVLFSVTCVWDLISTLQPCTQLSRPGVPFETLHRCRLVCNGGRCPSVVFFFLLTSCFSSLLRRIQFSSVDVVFFFLFSWKLLLLSSLSWCF